MNSVSLSKKGYGSISHQILVSFLLIRLSFYFLLNFYLISLNILCKSSLTRVNTPVDHIKLPKTSVVTTLKFTWINNSLSSPIIISSSSGFHSIWKWVNLDEPQHSTKSKAFFVFFPFPFPDPFAFFLPCPLCALLLKLLSFSIHNNMFSPKYGSGRFTYKQNNFIIIIF